MYCPTCGKENKDDAVFCSYCGRKIVIDDYDFSGIKSENTRHEAGSDETDTARKARKTQTQPLTRVTLTLLLILAAVCGAAWVSVDLYPKSARDEELTAASGAAGTSASSDTGEDAAGVSSDGSSAVDERTLDELEQSYWGENAVLSDFNFKCTFISSTLRSKVTDITVYLSPGADYFNPDPEYQIDLNASGDAVALREPGEYTLGWYAEGYCQWYENVTIGDEDVNMQINLIPSAANTANANIMLEWEGDHDLDLVAFDAHSGRYISILNPESDGNFLFEDTGSDRRCEVIRISNCMDTYVYTFYVRDDALLKNVSSGASESAMEKDGVRITVATKDGVLLRLEADPEQTSALWVPFYIYEGKAYTMDNYITDFSNETWAFYDKTVR